MCVYVCGYDITTEHRNNSKLTIKVNSTCDGSDGGKWIWKKESKKQNKNKKKHRSQHAIQSSPGGTKDG